MQKALKYQQWLVLHFRQIISPSNFTRLKLAECFGVAMSLLGTYMLARQVDSHLHGWIFYTLANISLFYVAFKKKLYVMNLMYLIFQVIAITAILRLIS